MSARPIPRSRREEIGRPGPKQPSAPAAPSPRRAAPALYSRLGDADLHAILRKMMLIRRFEESAEDAYQRGHIHGTMHLSIGEEATAVGICVPLAPTDFITSTHRGHGHCIAKGAHVDRMFAEFMGREDGYCRGRGGSMHIADIAIGNLGANGVVAGGIPIATGAALSMKMQKRESVVVSFFGDGATNEGAFHESLNMAGLWKLPAVFVCENNKYGMSTSTERSMAVKNVADRAAAYGMPGVIVDGNRVAEVAEASFAAVERARRGEGPTLIECKTYRWRGHSEHDPAFYRTDEELAMWKSRDPLTTFTTYLRHRNILAEDHLADVDARVKQEIDDAVAFAESSPDPDPHEGVTDLYA